MKSFIFKVIFTVLLVGNLSFIYGQCPPETIVLETQEDVDNFAINYPNCTNLQASLIINQTPITNLNGLSQIESIGLNLVIKRNLLLTSLNGLNNLETAFDLDIEENHELQNLEGLNNLSLLHGLLIINDNHSIVSLNGLNNLAFIGEGVSILHNPELISLNGLSGLNEIDGGLFIQNQNILTTLDGLENLTTIRGTLSIEINFGLINIEGIRNIDPFTIQRLQLSNNYELSVCDVQSICEYLGLPDYYGVIEGNNNGCNSEQEVEDACALGTQEIQISQIKIYPNPTNNTFEISGLKEGIIEIIDSQGRTVKQRVLNENHYSISELSSGIYFVKITSEKTSITKQLIKT